MAEAPNIVGDLRSQFTSFYDKISKRQRWVIIGVIFVVLIGLALVIYLSQQTTWITLYNGLDTKETSQIVSRLDEVQIPYRLAPGGGGVLVPIDKADEAKINIANSDLLNGGLVGLEIFDNGSFTMTEFQQNVQLRRAMEGELSRLIMQINVVDSAKVVLALPEKSVFIRDSQMPTAAVQLVLRSNSPLDSRIVRTILNLVASGVPGLITENIKISDQFGNLYSYDLKDSVYDNEDKNFQYKHKLEKYLENKVLDQLLLVAGQNGIKVKISAKINNEVQKIEENLLDPDLTAIVSEQSIQESSSGSGTYPIGAPGVTSNSPEINSDLNNEGINGSESDRRTKQTNYENSRRFIQREISSGNIERLTVSVLLDDKSEISTDDEGIEVINKRQWEQTELNEISSIVQNAVGFDSTRGDLIEVRNIAFATTIEDRLKITEEISVNQRELIFNLSRYALAGLLTFLLIILVIRPMIRQISPKIDVVKPSSSENIDHSGISGPVGQLGKVGSETSDNIIGSEQSKSSPQNIIEFAKDNPDMTVNAVRNWLKEA